jgi:hypothetical protein
MGITAKLNALSKELNETIKINFGNAADEIAKNKINIEGLAKICHSFSIIMMILKKKGIIKEEDFHEHNEDKEVFEKDSMEPKDTKPNENNRRCSES